MAYEKGVNTVANGDVCRESLSSRFLGAIGLLRGLMTLSPVAQYKFLANEIGSPEGSSQHKLSDDCIAEGRAQALASQAEVYLRDGKIPPDPGHWRIYYDGNGVVVFPEPFEFEQSQQEES